jgi:hypothetical protein
VPYIYISLSPPIAYCLPPSQTWQVPRSRTAVAFANLQLVQRYCRRGQIEQQTEPCFCARLDGNRRIVPYRDFPDRIVQIAVIARRDTVRIYEVEVQRTREETV